MQLSAIRALFTQLLITDLDNYAGDTPSTSDLNAQINRAIRIISEHVRPEWGKVALTISTNDQEIPFGSSKFARKMMSLSHIFKSANSQILIYNPQQFERMTDWRFASSGTPGLATVHNNTLRFDRPWASGTTLYVQGEGFYAPLVNDAEEPEFDEYAHEAVAYLAAVIAAKPSVTESTAMARLQMYSQEWFNTIDGLRKQVGEQRHDLSNVGPSQAW